MTFGLCTRGRFGPALTLALGLLAASPPAARAEIVLAARTVRAQSILAPEDLMLAAGQSQGAVASLQAAVGMETRVALFAGRAVLQDQIGPPALVQRNQIVRLIFVNGTLRIEAEGRALARGGAGEVVRVMNTLSRTTVEGRIAPDGSITISAGRDTQ